MSFTIFLRATVRASLLLAAATLPLRAQAADDGFLMPKRALTVGAFYMHESWNEYWEGTLKRTNENLGTVTTQSVTLAGMYGVTERLSVVASVPYLWTHASQGPLQGMRGVQDASFAAKLRLLSTPLARHGTLSALLVGAADVPASDYSPDFLPLSIGVASRRFTGRFTVNYQSENAWFVNASAAHTWRNKVTLDRNSYFTNGQFYLSNEVAMPRVFEGALTGGFRTGHLLVPISISQHRTLGGGDIRRQDMPFASNRMNFTKVDAAVAYAPKMLRLPAMRLGVSRTITGRNVGQATTVTFGSLYTVKL
ncbi:MAG: hypothetical protein JWL95_1983 [Gemmatimonadetes bacterium]|nr:hypothetical protein [Gemmatimonadota bacterium]